MRPKTTLRTLPQTGGDWGLRSLEETLTLGGHVTYVGKRLSDSDGTGRLITSNWDPYTVVGLFASYKLNETTRLDLSIENVGDRLYIDSLEDGFNPGPGRTFRMSMTAKF